MRAALWTLPLVLFGAGCAATTDTPGEAAPREGSGSAPAGFESWLVDQCPDGAVVEARNAETGEPVGTATCESLRGRALADASVRDRLIDVYMMQTADPTGDDRIGEVKEPWSPIGWLCGLAFSFMVGYGCDRSNINWRPCVGLGATPALACAILF